MLRIFGGFFLVFLFRWVARSLQGGYQEFRILVGVTTWANLMYKNPKLVMRVVHHWWPSCMHSMDVSHDSCLYIYIYIYMICKHILKKAFLNRHELFFCTQLNGLKYCSITITIFISHFFVCGLFYFDNQIARLGYLMLNPLYIYIYQIYRMCFGWVLWHINHCRLFKGKFLLYIYIKYIHNLLTHFVDNILKKSWALFCTQFVLFYP